MNTLLGFVWIMALALVYFLFERLCNDGFSQTAVETVTVWWRHGTGKWIVIISAVCLVVQAVLIQDVVTKLYALLAGRTEQRVLIGQGLTNELYYLNDDHEIEEVVTDIYDQQRFFADSFREVPRTDTVLRYGKSSRTVFQANALRTAAFLKSYAFIFACMLFAGLGFLVILGVNAAIVSPETATAETDFLNGWRWLLHHFRGALFSASALFLVLVAGSVVLANYRYSLQFKNLRHPVQPVSTALTEGDELTGTVLASANHIVTSNYTGEEVISSKRKVYRSYLVEFRNVHAHPVRLRFTVYKDKHTKDWIAETSGFKSREMKFVVVEDGAVWPEALLKKGITPVTN